MELYDLFEEKKKLMTLYLYIMYLPAGDSDFEIISIFADNTRGASVNNNSTRKRVIKLIIFFRKSCKLLSIIIK